MHSTWQKANIRTIQRVPMTDSGLNLIEKWAKHINSYPVEIQILIKHD